jgi:hypothetical protein
VTNRDQNRQFNEAVRLIEVELSLGGASGESESLPRLNGEDYTTKSLGTAIQLMRS